MVDVVVYVRGPIGLHMRGVVEVFVVDIHHWALFLLAYAFGTIGDLTGKRKREINSQLCKQYSNDSLNSCYSSIYFQVQVLNLISILIAHINEIIPFASKLVQFFEKVTEQQFLFSLLYIYIFFPL